MSNAREPLWAAHLVASCAALRGAPAAVESPAWKGAWLLVTTALLRYLRAHAARAGGVPAEDLEDLASQKSLELLTRIVSGAWDPSGHSPGQAAAYLSMAARSCLLDWLARDRRLVRPGSEVPSNPLDPAEEPGATAPEWSAGGGFETPDRAILRREFTEALCRCIRRLDRRSRKAWVLRALFEMTSRDIARHPDVDVRAGHVDVLLFRGRQVVRHCMSRRGHDIRDVPSGVLVDLWQRHHRGDLDMETDA